MSSPQRSSSGPRMAANATPPPGRSRLMEIARQFGVPVSRPRPLSLQKPPVRPVNPGDEIRAKQFIIQRQYTNPAGEGSRHTSLPPMQNNFLPKDINRALSAAVAGNADQALVAALLALGGDVNIARRASGNMWKKLCNLDQTDQRSNLLQVATQNRNLSLVQLLAAQADHLTLNTSLPIALRLGAVDIAKVLLECGADAESFHAEFPAAVRNGQEDLVELLLLAPKPLCSQCRDSSLLSAINSGSLRNTSMLILSDAAADKEEVLEVSLRLAIDRGRLDLFTAIVVCSERPASKALDGALASSSKVPAEQRSTFIEVCILGGAQGEHCSEMLFSAVKQREDRLVNTLIQHGASVDHRNGAALQHAIEGHQAALVCSMLQGNVAPVTLTTVCREQKASFLANLDFTHKVMSSFIAAGATKDIMAELCCAVVEHVQCTDVEFRLERLNPQAYRLATFLLDKGHADVDHLGGRLVQVIANGPFVDLLPHVLKQKPSKSSVNAAFSLATNIRYDHPKKPETIEMLLKSGARGDVVDKELVRVCQTGRDAISMVHVLLHGASVNSQRGQAIRAAIQNRQPELLNLLLRAKPSVITMEHVWTDAVYLSDSTYRSHVYNSLLKAETRTARGNEASVGYMSELPLVHSIQARNIEALELLLARGSLQGPVIDGALIKAAEEFSIEALQVVAGYATSSDTFTRAFNAAVQAREHWLSANGLEVVQFLLGKGVTGNTVDAALIQAAGRFNEDAVRLLHEAVEDPQSFTMAFNEALEDGDKWLSEEFYDLIDIYLAKGSGGECVDMALLDAVESYETASGCEMMVELLLFYKADVNYADGHAIQLAAEYGDVELLQKLFQSQPMPQSMSQGLVSAAQASHEGPRFINVLNTFMQNSNVKPDLNFVPPGKDPLLFIVLNSYPESPGVVKSLCDFGVDLNACVVCGVYDDENLEPENVYGLAWSLVQPGNLISDGVIGALIDAGANVTAALAVSKATPLLLAAKYNRPDAISRILKEGVKVSQKDRFDRSALFYASRHEDVKALKCLLKAKSPPNDGSLHEASRRLNAGAVKLLIKAGHDPDFPSTKHEGRTALAELCLNCDGARDPLALEETLEALRDGKADPMKKWLGKTPTFLALDNPDPVPVLDKLVEKIMWKYINDENNIYEEGDYFYSPTMYIMKVVLRGPHNQGHQLLQLLNNYGAVHRYYAKERLQQPADAQGLPASTIEFERKRQIREERLNQQIEDHQRRLKRVAEEAQQQAFIAEQAAIQRYRHREMDHTQAFEYRQQTHDQIFQHHQENHAQSLSLKQEQLRQKQIEVQESSQLKRDQLWKDEQQKAYIQQNQREKQLHFKRIEHQQKLGRLSQEQRMKLQHATNVDQRKLQTQSQLDQQKNAAQLRQNKLAASDRSNQVQSSKAKNKAMVAFKKDAAVVQHHEHKRRMEEMDAKRKNMQISMIQSKFNAEQKKIALANRKMIQNR